MGCVGQSGGLALLWTDYLLVTIQNYSRQYINATILSANHAEAWTFMGFYRHLETGKRKEALDLLHHLCRYEPMAWLCVGDFNKILEESGKLGGARHPRGQMEEFKNVLDHCCLSDLGYSGPRYTWTNKRTDSLFTQERLDRAVANAAWCGFFFLSPLVLVEVLAAQSFNHAPICFSLRRDSNGGQRRMRSFRYEAYWTKQTGWKEVIEKVWRIKN
jgi:hypothetical protein